MAKTAGGVRGNPRKDRIRTGKDVMKTMHRLIKTYGNSNRERIYRATRTVMENLSKNTGKPDKVLIMNPNLFGSSLPRR